jgi:ubiquinone/menaquinone biosynthesis C-methylase UbiE
MEVGSRQQVKDFYGDYWVEMAESIDFEKAKEFFHLLGISKSDLEGKRVIDIGCGTGAMTYAMAHAVRCSIDAVDYEERCVELTRRLLKQKGVAVNAFRNDIVNCTIGDRFYDTAISIGVLHHTGNSKKAMQEIYRILKPNGVVYLSLGRYVPFVWWFRHNLPKFARKLPKFLQKCFIGFLTFFFWIYYCVTRSVRFTSIRAAVEDMLFAAYHEYHTDDEWIRMMESAGFSQVTHITSHSVCGTQGVYRGIAIKQK